LKHRTFVHLDSAINIHFGIISTKFLLKRKILITFVGEKENKEHKKISL